MIAEVLGLLDDTRNTKPSTSSGVATAIGNPAVVTKSFETGEDGKLRGRVRFDGEDWKAIYIGDAGKPPGKGDEVTVVEIDTGHLEVQVK